mgnify:CR=1 FL=1
MTTPDILLREEIGAVTRLTLNRPERMNALSGQLARALDLALTDSLAPGSPTRALLITGAIGIIGYGCRRKLKAA